MKTNNNEVFCNFQHGLFHGMIILFMMLVVIAGCKKETVEQPVAQPTPDSSKAVDPAPDVKPETNPDQKAVQPEAKTENNNADTQIDNAAAPNKPSTEQTNPASQKKCEKWGTNPIFADNHIFDYQVKIERSACCDLDKDDPSWDCDENGMCELDKTVINQCKSSLIHAETDFCASLIQCEKDSECDEFVGGLWVIDSNGLYRFGANQKLSFDKQIPPGNCKNTKNIQCKPGTLAYEYTEFAKEDPLIPFVKKDIQIDECDDDGVVCTSYRLNHKGTVWKLQTSAEGGDSSSDELTLDETRGITEFLNEFSGGSERHVEGKLIY